MKPSLKINNFEPAIPQRLASPHSLDGFARARKRRSEFMKALMLAAAALFLAATTMFARTPAFDESPKEASPTATASSQDQATQNQAAPPAAPSSTTTSTASGEGPTAGAA